MATRYRKLGVLIGCAVLALLIASSEGGTQDFCTLTVNKTGNGTVTSTPAGINCGTDCTQTYLCGTTVQLTATAAAGSTLIGEFPVMGQEIVTRAQHPVSRDPIQHNWRQQGKFLGHPHP